eukprot:6208101-Pleurochrysis_carterae.AAC.1
MQIDAHAGGRTSGRTDRRADGRMSELACRRACLVCLSLRSVCQNRHTSDTRLAQLITLCLSHQRLVLDLRQDAHAGESTRSHQANEVSINLPLGTTMLLTPQ